MHLKVLCYLFRDYNTEDIKAMVHQAKHNNKPDIWDPAYDGGGMIPKWREERQKQMTDRKPYFLFYVHTLDLETLHSFAQNINFMVLLQMLFAGLAVYVFQTYDIWFDLHVTLFVSPIVFPLAFSINTDFQRREKVLEDLAQCKSSGMIWYFCMRDWKQPAQLDNEWISVVHSKLKTMLFHLREYLLTYKMERRRVILRAVYEDFSDMNQLIEKLRASKLPSNTAIISRSVHLLNMMCLSFERLRVVREYRSPRSIRSFNKVLTIFLPIILAPYFVYIGIKSKSVWEPYFIAILVAFVFSALQGVQDKLDDPFDGMSEDDIHFETFDEWNSSLEFIMKRKFTVGRRVKDNLGKYYSQFKTSFDEKVSSKIRQQNESIRNRTSKRGFSVHQNDFSSIFSSIEEVKEVQHDEKIGLMDPAPSQNPLMGKIFQPNGMQDVNNGRETKSVYDNVPTTIEMQCLVGANNCGQNTDEKRTSFVQSIKGTDIHVSQNDCGQNDCGQNDCGQNTPGMPNQIEPNNCEQNLHGLYSNIVQSVSEIETHVAQNNCDQDLQELYSTNLQSVTEMQIHIESSNYEQDSNELHNTNLHSTVEMPNYIALNNCEQDIHLTEMRIHVVPTNGGQDTHELSNIKLHSVKERHNYISPNNCEQSCHDLCTNNKHSEMHIDRAQNNCEQNLHGLCSNIVQSVTEIETHVAQNNCDQDLQELYSTNLQSVTEMQIHIESSNYEQDSHESHNNDVESPIEMQKHVDPNNYREDTYNGVQSSPEVQNEVGPFHEGCIRKSTTPTKPTYKHNEELPVVSCNWKMLNAPTRRKYFANGNIY